MATDNDLGVKDVDTNNESNVNSSVQTGQDHDLGVKNVETVTSNAISGNDQSQQDNKSSTDQFSETGGDILRGGLKGAESTVAGVSNLLHKLPFGLGEKLAPESGIQAMEKNSEPKNFSEALGYGGESLAELLFPDTEVAKGLSYAGRLAEVAKVAKVLENYPNVMNALKLGSWLGKFSGTLAPEEVEVLQKYPRLAHALGSSFRFGLEQGTQTAERTGSVKEGAKQGAETAVGSAALGVPLAGAGAVLEKGTQAAKETGEALHNIQSLGENVVPASDITEKTRTALQNKEDVMHSDFDAGIKDLEQRLKDETIPSSDNPLAEKAGKLLTEPQPAEHSHVQTATKIAGEGLTDSVKKLLTDINDGTSSVGDTTTKAKDLNIHDLIQLRQRIRQAANGFEIGNINSRTLRQLLPSIDDTIGKLAEQSKDPTAVQDYETLRKNYRTTINQLESPSIEKIRNNDPGKSINDIGSYLLSNKQEAPAKIQNLRDLLGDQHVDEIAQNVFKNEVKKAGLDEVGNFDPLKFKPDRLINWWSKLTPETKNILFKGSTQDLNNTISKTAMADIRQKLARSGLIGTGVLEFPKLGFLTLLYKFYGGIGVKEATDYLVNNPQKWEQLGGKLEQTSKKLEENRPIIEKGTKAIANTATQAVNPYASNLRQILGNATGLGQGQ